MTKRCQAETGDQRGVPTTHRHLIYQNEKKTKGANLAPFVSLIGMQKN